MEKEIEIIKISDTSEDESERVLKERKREDAIRELGKAIKEGRWMRSDVVAALAIYKWRQISKDLKGVFINDNVVILTQPLKKQDQFVAIAKEFKKWAFQPFKYLCVIVCKDAHFSTFLFCNSSIGLYTEGTSLVHLDPLHYHDSNELQLYLSR